MAIYKVKRVDPLSNYFRFRLYKQQRFLGFPWWHEVDRFNDGSKDYVDLRIRLYEQQNKYKYEYPRYHYTGEDV